METEHRDGEFNDKPSPYNNYKNFVQNLKRTAEEIDKVERYRVENDEIYAIFSTLR